MEFFIDTADVDAIRKAHAMGLVDGVTTNPTLIKKAGRDHKETIQEIYLSSVTCIDFIVCSAFFRASGSVLKGCY